MTGRLCPELAADYPDDLAPLDSPMALTRLYGAIGEALRTAASPGPGRAAGRRDRGRGRALGRRPVPGPAGLPGPPAGRAGRCCCAISWSGRARGTAPGAAGRAQRGGRRRPGHRGRACPAARGAHPEPAAALRGSATPDVGRLLAQTRGLPMLVGSTWKDCARGPVTAASGGGRPPRSGNCCAGGCRPPASPPCRCCPPPRSWAAGATPTCSARSAGAGEAETVEALDEAVRRFLLTEVPPAGERGGPPLRLPV